MDIKNSYLDKYAKHIQITAGIMFAVVFLYFSYQFIFAGVLVEVTSPIPLLGIVMETVIELVHAALFAAVAAGLVGSILATAVSLMDTAAAIFTVLVLKKKH